MVFFRYLGAFILFILFVFSLQYYATRIHRFEAGKPFEGEVIYNPYAGFSGTWQRANFHAHASAWGGITEGNQTPEMVANAYKDAGYDIVSISDYMKINMTPVDEGISNVPMYEHGYNVRKTHQLVLDAYKPAYLDFPLLQGRNQKQTMLTHLKKKSGNYVALAHPKFMYGYSIRDMRYLSGYDFIEVLNHYRTSDKHWDEALSHGYAAWLLSNDDCHDIRKESETFRMWNMIGSPTTDKESVFEALKAGRHYGVHKRGGQQPNYLDSVRIQGMAVEVYFREPVEKAEIIRDGGEVKQVIEHQQTMRFEFAQEDSYLRLVAYDEGGEIWLNPFIRYDGENLPDPATLEARVLLIPTLLHILLWAGVHFLMLWLIWKLAKRRK